jgi:response regulator RpfG family c-di-GMP phosphodiesterase
MPQLIPHLLLRSDHASSETAIALRDAGYHVTKVKEDEIALRTLGVLPVDGVVIELPVVSTVTFLRRLTASVRALPVLVLTVAPDVLRRTFAALEPYDLRDGRRDLVSAPDLALARFEQMSQQRLRNVS